MSREKQAIAIKTRHVIGLTCKKLQRLITFGHSFFFAKTQSYEICFKTENVLKYERHF
jgi:hypothetical protein